MKTNSTLSYLKNFKLLSGLAITMVFTQACSVNESGTMPIAKRTKASRKERDVRIYPDVLKKTMHVRNMENIEVDFFVFDAEGTILVHYKMNERDHKKINGLERGTYTYQVFKKDEMSESGKIIIK